MGAGTSALHFIDGSHMSLLLSSSTAHSRAVGTPHTITNTNRHTTRDHTAREHTERRHSNLTNTMGV